MSINYCVGARHKGKQTASRTTDTHAETTGDRAYPRSPDSFASALESLDTDAFAALVAEAYAAIANAVAVTGSRTTVTGGDRRTELLAVVTGDEAAPADAVNAVVVADDAPCDGRTDGRVVTPTSGVASLGRCRRPRESVDEAWFITGVANGYRVCTAHYSS